MIVRSTRSSPSRPQSMANGPAMDCMKPLFPSNTSAGPVIPRCASRVACVAADAANGAASPFQWESVPVRVTRNALSAVPLMAIAFAVCACIERKCARHSSGDGIRELRGVVESAVAHRRRITQSALHLIRDRKRSEQRRAIGIRQLGCREHRTQVVRWMTGLARRKIAVVEIEVADKRAVVQRRTIRRAATTTDECAGTVVERNPRRIAAHDARDRHRTLRARTRARPECES